MTEHLEPPSISGLTLESGSPALEAFAPGLDLEETPSTVAFSNPDIVCEVFGYLAVDLRETGFSKYCDLRATRDGLLSLALTSKRFLEPALDLLWRTMNSIMPLLNLLGECLRWDSGEYVSSLYSFLF